MEELNVLSKFLGVIAFCIIWVMPHWLVRKMHRITIATKRQKGKPVQENFVWYFFATLVFNWLFVGYIFFGEYTMRNDD